MMTIPDFVRHSNFMQKNKIMYSGKCLPKVVDSNAAFTVANRIARRFVPDFASRKCERNGSVSDRSMRRNAPER